MTDALHPARSSEFLSRLHDGELSHSERSAFESHRASCGECRDAAEKFERTLSLFRSAPTVAPASDLSARILRKIRAQSPSRRPFGVMFGIDVRWAGAFVAALLVVVLAAPLLLRRQSAVPRASPHEAIPARILEAPPAGRKDAPPESPPAAPPPRSGRMPIRERPPAKANARETGAIEYAPAPPAASESRAADEVAQREVAAPKAEAKRAAPMALRGTSAPEPAGGEAAASSAAEPPAPRIRLTIRALDGQGEAPAVAGSPTDERLALLRGQEFVLVVESQGRVREVLPATRAGGLVSKEKARPADANKLIDPSQLLSDLRFEPGDRPRRLLVRVE